ncbi:Curli production assembly/transport component CsgG [Sulfidibacter corallicola]|uniref:Curli production assembly/transport component CsgG n=1 Tax=Sulfidibacter corallicola TaxID=2818388 RepID=A0A8A4TLU4_SULCO|nr:CsgG/HfaB family protein [Sulfidibacter corallicola]QTD50530.1 hypothetical protein J3U87_33520 [Sulfidibacter corallicola]
MNSVMHRLPVRTIAAVCFLMGAAHPLLAQGGLRYTVQVLKFENRAGWSAQWDLGEAWEAVLSEELNKSGNFIVIAGTDARKASMDEQDFAQSGRAASGDKGPKTGFMTPAQLIVTGTIDSFDDGTEGRGSSASYRGIGLRFKGGTSIIGGTVSFVDATTGQEIASHRFEEKVKNKGVKLSYSKWGFYGDVDAFRKTPSGKVIAKACDNVLGFLAGQLDNVIWTGKVIRADSGRIMINRGTREGVSEGQILKVGYSEEIRDPDTGELLDLDLTEKGRIRVKTVKEKLSICEPISVDGKKPYKPKQGQTVFN